MFKRSIYYYIEISCVGARIEILGYFKPSLFQQKPVVNLDLQASPEELVKAKAGSVEQLVAHVSVWFRNLLLVNIMYTAYIYNAYLILTMSICIFHTCIHCKSSIYCLLSTQD